VALLFVNAQEIFNSHDSYSSAARSLCD